MYVYIYIYTCIYVYIYVCFLGQIKGTLFRKCLCGWGLNKCRVWDFGIEGLGFRV